MPFGQMPVLEANGKKYHQSLAITRFLAKKAKLTGQNEWEDLEIDSVVDTVNDLRQSKLFYIFSSKFIDNMILIIWFPSRDWPVLI